MNAINQGLLTLLAPRKIEEDLVDFFLDNEHQYGFTSQHLRGHSLDHSDMSPVEQVTGRQHQIQFQVLVNETQVDDICTRLKAAFPEVGIRYWYLPSAQQGRL